MANVIFIYLQRFMTVCVYNFLCIYNRMVPNWVPQKTAYPRNESRLS